MTAVSLPEFLNEAAGPQWSPGAFAIRTVQGAKTVAGMTRLGIALYSPFDNGHTALNPARTAAPNVNLHHLPTGRYLAGCRHGAHAYRLADDLLAIEPFRRRAGFREIVACLPAIESALARHGGLA